LLSSSYSFFSLLYYKDKDTRKASKT
jgi:hypothetical protein